MLDKNALTQLKSLKKEIHDSTPRHEGRVRATAGRFGFVNTEDKQQFFLSPDEMEKVLPGDQVAFRVEAAGEGKQQAIVEKVLSSDVNGFFGTYVVRGKGHFIEPDDDLLNRWIFVPPAKRMKAQEGDLVRAHISQHPYPNGRAQAHIDEIIGKPDEAHIEHDFILAKYAIPSGFSDEVNQQVAELVEKGLDEELNNRTDLTHLPFVTIDSAGTRDIDDALYAEAHSQGWSLWIAIADPAALISANSALDKTAALSATSSYFPDRMLPMLPAELSEQLCSLQENELRLAMVVELKVAEDGSIESTNIHNAKIRSQAKLSYTQVAQLINGEDNEIPAELHGHIIHLHNCSQALSSFREQNCLIMEERPDYKIITDEQGKAKEIVKLERNQAHRLVEECMLACNRSIASWLAEKESGFFINHNGVRTERIGEVVALIREQLELERKPKIQTLAEFVEWVQKAEQSDSTLPLRTIISRQLERSNLSLEAGAHFGLGFEHYTTFSSPLRKYNDLLLHRLIKELLNGEALQLPTEEQLADIQQRQTTSRNAAWQTESWLKLNWLAQQEKDAQYDASIVHMNSQNFTVRLEDSGIEGTIDRRKAKDWTFDTKTLSHYKGDERFILNQVVRVSVAEIKTGSRTVRFTLV
ncbi:ribonuclease R family protein [Bacterioplanoides sp.]|uniref:ribonuclease R family protein n=1 Tax=Bacterioplanoides sp. TaxID=2066072 RepID=UPI003B5C840D